MRGKKNEMRALKRRRRRNEPKGQSLGFITQFTDGIVDGSFK